MTGTNHEARSRTEQELGDKKLGVVKETENYRFTVLGHSAEILEYVGSKTCVDIPEILGDCTVTSIGERAFYNTAIIKVTTPDSVVALGKEAFSCCRNLVEININTSLTTISSFCFSSCSALKKVTLPESLTTLHEAAFYNCSNLEEVEIPRGIAVLNAELFFGCEKLKQIGLPHNLNRICSEVFKNCSNLENFYYCSIPTTKHIMMSANQKKRTYELPDHISHIGKNAFENCASLRKIRIPYKVSIINEGVFKNCTVLAKVHVHSSLKEIKNEAFYGCENLEEIKLPGFTKKIGDNVFSRKTEILCEGEDFGAIYAAQNALPCRYIVKTTPPLSSHMIPSQNEQVNLSDCTSFYTEEDLRKCVEKFEMRPPSYEYIQRSNMAVEEEIASSRFVYKEGKYINKNRTAEGRATIMMTGDLMALPRYQGFSSKADRYIFDSSFHFVKDILQQSDFAIGNLESLVAPSAPLMIETEYVDGVLHLNAPESYLRAIKEASFDAVINAQNHIYDAGVRGIFETLDMQNKYQLMHTGAFVGNEDKRYLMLEINGIRIACVSYFDLARQPTRSVNFTNIGKQTLFSLLGIQETVLQQITQDIEDAKAEGAEFIIAFCHWGKEYTNELTDRQILFSKTIAKAGANYIFGSHPHCVQPYDVITTDDGRSVPVFYSAGNFMSDSSAWSSVSRDTIIGELVLRKDESKGVYIESSGYYPCKIMNLEKDSFTYTVIPTAMKFEGSPAKNKYLSDAEIKIEKNIGAKIKKLIPQGIVLTVIKKSQAKGDSEAYHKTKHLKTGDDSLVFTIEELCYLLKIELPKQYQENSSFFVTQTSLFNRLENKEKLLREIKETEDYCYHHYEEIKANAAQFKNHYCGVGNTRKTETELLEMFVEWIYIFRPLGFYPDDYFNYELYDKTITEANEFISGEYRRKIAKVCRNNSYLKYFLNKVFFLKTFSRYVKRDYLDTTSCTLSEFKAFTEKNPQFFGKPILGSGGHNSGIFESNDNDIQLLQKCKKEKLIVEEIVRQHESLAAFNKSTLNTIRIYTLLTANNEAIVMLAGARFGRASAVVDNFHSGGLTAGVDILTGMVVTDAINRDHVRYSVHPDSLLEFRGFQVPCWNQAIETVKESAKQMPHVRHVGWDVAITNQNEIELIEGNSLPNFDITQAVDQIGKKYLYEEHINELEAVAKKKDSKRK